jgi:repressor LexA
MDDQLDAHELGIWHFVAEYKQAHDGRSPSYAEIGRAVGIPSKDHVDRDLKKLAKRKILRVGRRMARGIELLQHPDQRHSNGTIALPLLGIIHASFKFPTPEQNTTPLDWIQVAQNLVGNKKNTYLLKVAGDSMIDALVKDGDLVLLEPTKSANNGDMVAVWLKSHHSMTLKKIFFRDDRVILKPVNPTLREKSFKASDVQIQGKVLCIIRNTQNGEHPFAARV